MRIVIVLLVFVFAVSCSDSGNQCDTCGQLTDPVPVCVHGDLPDSALDLSRRVWGVYSDCDDSDALQIVVSDTYPHCGTASGGMAKIDPVCRYHGDVVAHELGHLLGFGHVTDDECALMAPRVPPRKCTMVSIDGCRYER